MKYTITVIDKSIFWQDDEIREALHDAGFENVHVVIHTEDGPTSLLRDFDEEGNKIINNDKPVDNGAFG